MCFVYKWGMVETVYREQGEEFDPNDFMIGNRNSANSAHLDQLAPYGVRELDIRLNC